MQTTRVLLYPEGTDDEIDFISWEGGPVLPVVGDQVQTLDRDGTNYERGPLWEVTGRALYSTRYGPSYYVLEVALTVKEVAT